MASVLGVLGLLFIVVVNSALAALMTRFFRVRLHTRWASLLYAVVLTPVVMVLVVIVFSGIFGLGSGLDLGSRATVVLLTVVVPLGLGITFDYFWMPAPDEIDLPEAAS